MVRTMHTRLLEALASEQVSFVVVQILKTLAVLISQCSYSKLEGAYLREVENALHNPLGHRGR